ncbi:GGDEF domain-containing protein [Frateuria aurantia]
MPSYPARERYAGHASMIMLALTAFAAGCATLVGWTSPHRAWLDMTIPPCMLVIFSSLLVAQWRRPEWMPRIVRLALLAALFALAAPAWFYTWQARLRPEIPLVTSYPPVASLLLAYMVMVMLFLPPRQATVLVTTAWTCVAMPVLVYLLGHPGELHSPRGTDLLMTYGPVVILLVVLLPVQRALTGKIQQLVSTQEAMESIVNRDPLTGLYNRRFGELALLDMCQRKRPGGVIMFDMDRFKAINDTYGHPMGDRVLKKVAQLCQEQLRKDECISRWGGEEFLVVVPQIDQAGLKALAERLRAAIAAQAPEPLQLMTASFGATVAEDGDDSHRLLQRVDQALYRAKQHGGNSVAC